MNETLMSSSTLKLTPEQMIELKSELCAVIEEHAADSAEFMRNLIITRRLYEMKARRKTWPFPGAASFIIPLVRYAVDSYKSRLTQGIRLASNSLFYGKVYGRASSDGTNYDWDQVAGDGAEFLNFVCTDPMHVKFFEAIDQIAEGITKDAVAPIKVHWVERTRNRAIRNERGKIESIPEVIESRVAWDVIDLKRTVWTIGGSDPSDMPVFGHWMELTRAHIRKMGRDFKIPLDEIERVLNSPDQPYMMTEDRILDEENGISRSAMAESYKIYRIYELKIEFPLKPDAEPSILTVWFHKESGTLLRVFDPSDYADPWEAAHFLRRGKQFLSTCVAEALRTLNLGGNALFNQTIDAQTVSNAFGILYKSDSTLGAFLSQSQAYPGMRLPFDDDPKKEFETFKLGDGQVVGSAMGMFNVILSLAEMVAKLGPGGSGQIGAASRVSASVGLGIMQESAQMVDAVSANLRDVIERCGMRTLYLYAMHSPETFDKVLTPERATALLSALREKSFPSNLKIHLDLSSSTANKERSRQDLMVLANFMTSFFNTVVSQGAAAMNPMAPPEYKMVVATAYKGMHEVVSKLIEQFDQFKDSDEVLSPELVEMMQQGAMAPPPQPVFPQVQQGGGGGQQGGGPQSGGGPSSSPQGGSQQ